MAAAVGRDSDGAMVVGARDARRRAPYQRLCFHRDRAKPRTGSGRLDSQTARFGLSAMGRDGAGAMLVPARLRGAPAHRRRADRACSSGSNTVTGLLLAATIALPLLLLLACASSK